MSEQKDGEKEQNTGERITEAILVHPILIFFLFPIRYIVIFVLIFSSAFYFFNIIFFCIYLCIYTLEYIQVLEIKVIIPFGCMFVIFSCNSLEDPV